MGVDFADGAAAGPAGGVLTGTYPNPAFAVDMATQAELDALTAAVAASMGGIPMTSGLWHYIGGPGATGNAGNNNRAIMMPFLAGRSCTLNGVSIEVTAAGDAGSVVRLGIYDDVAGLPTNRIADFGTVTGDTIAVKTLTPSLALTPRWYWLCAAVQLAPAVRPTWRTSNIAILPGRSGNVTAGGNVTNFGYFFDAGFNGALPATAGTATGAITAANIPAFQVRAA